MKRILFVLFVILAVLTISVTSCNNEVSVETKGTLVVKISGGQSRGILPSVSMVSTGYDVSVMDASGNVVAKASLGADESSTSFELEEGSYKVSVDSKNTDGTVIGSGEEEIKVSAGATNSVTIIITECAGNGNFTVALSGNDGYSLSLRLYNEAEEKKYEKDLKYSEGSYINDGEIALSNGFYRFEIVRADTNKIVKADTVRIVKGFISSYEATFSFQSDGSITIVNEMVNIPTIKISLKNGTLGQSDKLEASAEVSGITGFTACWFVDGEAVGKYGEYADLSHEIAGLEAGDHEVALCVKNSQVMWSEGVVFEVEGPKGISLASLPAGGSMELTGLKADSEIELSDFSLEDGVYIEVVNTSRGIGASGSGADNLFVRADGTFMPIPDEDGYTKFTADCLGTIENAKVIVHKLDKLDIDLAISPSEYPGLMGVAEEFYYINFLDPRFFGLDPREIVLVKSGAVSAQGISVLQRGMLNSDVEGTLDFSGKWFTGFAVNMHMVLYGKDMDTMKLNVLNPIHVNSKARKLNGDVNVIMVDEQDSKDYKVVVTFTGDNTSEVVRNIALNYNALQLHPRYVNGDNRLPNVFPEFDLENRTITYHVGKVDEAFMFNLDYDSLNTGFKSGYASVVLVEDTEGIEIHDLDSLGETTELIATAGKVVTWAFEAKSEQLFNTQFSAGGDANIYVISEGRGGGSGIPNTMRVCGSGFFRLYYEGPEESISLVTLTRTEYQSIECGAISWNSETADYVCVDDNCVFCTVNGEKQHYSRAFIIENMDAIFKERYVTAYPFGDYGFITYGDGLYIGADNVDFGGGTVGGRGGNNPMGTRVWDLNDVDTMVMIELTGINQDENYITCNIAIDNTDDFAMNVPMYPVGTLPGVQLDRIAVTGTPAVQKEQSKIDYSGLTVTAYYSDGTTADVTNRAMFKTEKNTDTWGSVLSYSDGSWNTDYRHDIMVSYTFKGKRMYANSRAFMLHATNDANTYLTAYELPIKDNSYIVLDATGFTNVVSPYVADENPSGYLINGTTAGNNAVMVFPYESYSKNTPVDIQAFAGMIENYDVKMKSDKNSPEFDWLSSPDGQSTILVFSINGKASPGTAVVVYGQLANDIDPAVGIKRSDFVAGSTKTFFVKMVKSRN